MGHFTRLLHPFHVDAWVVLPNHLHAVWTLPDGDADFSLRWWSIKRYFSTGVADASPRSASRIRQGERGLWLRRFWEHTIRDDRDYVAHTDYIHFNPVKHRLVEFVKDWPFSIFHRAVARGDYPAAWGGPIGGREGRRLR